MLKNLFKDSAAIERLRREPYGPFLDSWAESLLDDGYAHSTVRLYLRVITEFSRWAALGGLSICDLDESVVGAFAEVRHREGCLHPRYRAAVTRLLEHLRAEGVVATPKPVARETPAVQLVGRYEGYLRVERGLAPVTVKDYRAFVHSFLAELFGDAALRLGELGPADLSRFILRHAPSMSRGRAKLMSTALRSFLRFLFQRGEIEADLAACVPSVPNWRLSGIPKYLGVEEVEALLGACDRRTGTGRRDYAILLLLARLGLRAGEVVALELDDIDWRAGELTVPGKGLRRDRLPLFADVGEALAVYLRRDRLPSLTRRVFVRRRAPHRGFAGPSTVGTIVRRALERAGLDPPGKGAHLLRHSLATGMLRSGASMAEIAEVLRHRAPTTTEIYAKVDLDGLRSLAQPWPVTGGGR